MNNKLIKKCRLTGEELVKTVKGVPENSVAAFDAALKAQLTKAIPIIRVEEREKINKDYETTFNFALNIAKHFDECRDSRIFFIMQQAFGDIDWEETEDLIKTVISQGQALSGGN